MPATMPCVALRGAVLAEEATLSESDQGIFVALDRPPPVHAVVELRTGGRARHLEVLRVMESAEAGGARGFWGRFVDPEPGHLLRVGTEQLPGGQPGAVSPVDRSDSGPESSSRYPVPAPVLEPEPSRPIDLRDASPQALAEGVEDVDAAGDDGEPDPASGRGKRRKGRRRG